MCNIEINKNTKNSTPFHLILFGLMSLPDTTPTLSPEHSGTKNSHDYILKKYSGQVSSIQEEAICTALANMHKAMCAPAQLDVSLFQLLALITHSSITQPYGSKYLFASNGLLARSIAKQKVHFLHDHLLKAPPRSVIWQGLSFQPKLVVKRCLFSKKVPAYMSSRHRGTHFLHQYLSIKKGGYQGPP